MFVLVTGSDRKHVSEVAWRAANALRPERRMHGSPVVLDSPMLTEPMVTEVVDRCLKMDWPVVATRPACKGFEHPDRTTAQRLTDIYGSALLPFAADLVYLVDGTGHATLIKDRDGDGGLPIT